MLNYTIKFIKSQKVLYFYIPLFIFSVFFPIRHVFLTEYSYKLGQYSDFTSFSLYLSDILVFFGFLCILLQKYLINKQKKQNFPIFSLFVIFIFWLILNLFYHHQTISALNIYFFSKWLEFVIVAYGTLIISSLIVNSYKQALVKIFLLFISFQSIIALLQFIKQSSLGLYRLGEQHISPTINGVAKLVVNGQTYIRGYGTFPHPNVLAAFLSVSILILLYFTLNPSKRSQFLYFFLLFLNILGLVITFSRAAIFSLCLSLIFVFSYLIYKNFNLGLLSKTALTIIFSFLISFLIFKPFLISRATVSDSAVVERVEYNKIAKNMIISNSFWGLGVGESVLHMEQYSTADLKPWENQPIHNYFLISAADLGITGALILIFVFLHLFTSVLKKLWSNFSIYSLLLSGLLMMFLTLMFFDHYFYTLEQTQLLLWVMIGLIIAELSEKNKSILKS